MINTQRNYRTGVFAAALGRNLALEEENTDGKAAKEIEFMFYAKVPDPQFLLRAATFEIQEQWGLWYDKTDKNAAKGSVRVRKAITSDIVDGAIREETKRVQCVQTVKIKTADGASIEIPSESSEDGLAAFKLLADSGMIKHRYSFPIAGSGLKWEVDMFLVPGASIHELRYLPWCKIDLEVPNKDYPIPELPYGFNESFLANDKDALTPEQKAIADEMQTYLSLPNPHLKKMYEGVV